MIVLVCGSRCVTRAHLPLIREELAQLPAGSVVMHGDQGVVVAGVVVSGADKLAGEVAEALGLKVDAYPAAWQVYGRRAGMIRNRVMLDRRPAWVIAFWDGESAGTRDTVVEARKRGIPVKVVGIDPWSG